MQAAGQRRRPGAPLGQDLGRDPAGEGHEREILPEVHDAEIEHAGLARAGGVSGAARFEVEAGHVEPVAHSGEGLEPSARLGPERIMEKDAMRRAGAATDASPELVELKEPEPVGGFHHHDCGGRHVNAHLDDGGGDQDTHPSVLERLHGFLTTRRGHPPVDQRHGGGGKVGEKLAVTSCGAGAVVLRRVLLVSDPGRDPVGLLGSFEATAAETGHEFRPPGVGEHRGRDRGSPGRSFGDRREVNAAVEREGERARDRGRGHDELMRLAVVVTRIVEGLALHDAEAVLLVHDHETQRAEADPALKKSVGADDEAGFGGGNPRTERAALRGGNASPQPEHGDAERGQLGGEARAMLMGQHLGGGQKGHLLSGFESVERGQGRDECLAASDVALKHPDHRLGPAEVAADVFERLMLSGRRTPRQLGKIAGGKVARGSERRRRSGGQPPAPEPGPQDMGREFFGGETPPGPFQKKRKIGPGGGGVQNAQGFGERRGLESRPPE